MPTNKRKELSHEEIWDDTALIDSWDEALREYKLYHSIHARGERVADVLADESRSIDRLNDAGLGQGEQDAGEAHHERDDILMAGSEEGEVEEPIVMNPSAPSQTGSNRTTLIPGAEEQKPGSSFGAHASQPSGRGLPPSLLVGEQNEAMKNLMMAWYYAGYYTGLYDGQQQAKREEYPT